MRWSPTDLPGNGQSGPGAGHRPADPAKRMVGKVLTDNGITRCERGTYALVGGEELSDGERDQLLELCRQRLDAFRQQPGGGGVCPPQPPPHPDQRLGEVPGAHQDQRPLRVLRGTRAPASSGGGPHRSVGEAFREAVEPRRFRRPLQPAVPLLPLQRRQARCCLPTQEGATVFRGLQASYARREADCVFCALEGSGRVLLENELALCIANAYPVTPGHSLVIPRRHGADGLALHQPESNAAVELLKERREQLFAQDATISGWNVGLNSGEAAGQTVFHAHWHLIPRREDDCEEPRGGVRGVIAGKQGY